jgi:predicted dienelactone hydrolase
MLPLDILLTLGLSAFVLSCVGRASRSARIVRAVSLVIALLSGLVDVWTGRWQAVPALVLAALALVGCVGMVAARRRIDSRGVRILGAIGVGAYVLAATAAVLLLLQVPVWSTPTPDGEYSVGVVDLEITDRQRSEPSDPKGKAPRRLMVRAWYPATKTRGLSPRRYRTPVESTAMSAAFADSLRLPRFLFSHLTLVRTHSHPGAPIAAVGSPFPVVIYSHGYLGTVESNTALMEHLASHGYLALSVTHPFESAAVVYPNGDVVSLDPEVSTYMRERQLDQDTRTLISSTDIGERYAATRRLYGRATRLSRSVAVWRDDMLTVANALSQPAAFSGAREVLARADVTRIAFAGMSFGGPAAVHACEAEQHCRAAVNLDGREHTLDFFDRAVRAPLLMLSQGTDQLAAGLRYNDFHYEPVVEAGCRKDIHRYIVAGTGHWDFTDLTYVAHGLARRLLIYPTLLGEHGGDELTNVLDGAVQEFLDQYVKGSADASVTQYAGQHPRLQSQDLARIREWARRVQRSPPA